MCFNIFFAFALFFSLPSFVMANFCNPLTPNDCKNLFPKIGDDLIMTDVLVEHVFIPKGMDTNDLSAVVVFGWLPSPCYQSLQGKTNFIGKTIQVSAQAFKAPDRICIPMAVPYLSTTTLGILERGEFLVQFQNQRNAFVDAGILSIETPKADTIDNFIYAHVERVEANEDASKITLSGRNPSDCFELDHVENIFNGSDAYAVLPIMKQVKADCPVKMVPFRYEIDISQQKKGKRVLWHVRSLGGKAINVVWDAQYGFLYW
jgi:hypothetical protein